jgi:hypothetical protein
MPSLIVKGQAERAAGESHAGRNALTFRRKGRVGRN